MEIPVQAQVECTDGVCGRSVYVLIDPVAEKVTHLVVQEASAPHTEYVVPVDRVSSTVAGTIRLRCTRAELAKMDHFAKTHFVEEKTGGSFVVSGGGSGFGGGGGGYGIGTYLYYPYVIPERTVQVPVESLQIPRGELAVRRGTRVEATDGFVGHVDEFVVNAEKGAITHLVMREGHAWGKKDVIIPLSAMGKTRGDTMFLTIDKHQIESLPTFPVQRHWS